MDDLNKMREQMIEQLQAFVKRQDSIIANQKEQIDNLKAQLRITEDQVRRLR